MSDLSIVVVTTASRPSLAVEHLERAGVPFLRHVDSGDRQLPTGFRNPHPAYRRIPRNELGAYRCYAAHQSALGLVSSFPVLVLEDDAVPVNDWLAQCQSALGLLDRYRAVSMHGRDVRRGGSFTHRGMGFVLPGIHPTFRVRWAMGSLAYLIGASGAKHLRETPYEGIPMDHFLAEKLRCCVRSVSPFLHDRRHGSLVEGAA